MESPEGGLYNYNLIFDKGAQKKFSREKVYFPANGVRTIGHLYVEEDPQSILTFYINVLKTV